MITVTTRARKAFKELAEKAGAEAMLVHRIVMFGFG
jgi:hypothetical protein